MGGLKIILDKEKRRFGGGFLMGFVGSFDSFIEEFILDCFGINLK